MALDPTIALQGQVPQFVNPLQLYGQVTQLQNQMGQNRLQQMAMQQSQRELDNEQKLNAVYGAAISPDGSIDRTKLYSGLATGGLGAKLPAVQQQFATADKSARDAEKVQLENAKARIDLFGQGLGAAKDQSSWDAGRQLLAKSGVDISAVPTQFTPQDAEAARNHALTVSQQLDQVWKAKGYDLDVAKFGESSRHNRVDEGIAGGNLGIARQRLALDQTAGTVQTDANGNMVMVPSKMVAGQAVTARPVVDQSGQPLTSNKGLTETQGNALGFGMRAKAAQQIANTLESQGVGNPGIAQKALNSIPIVGNSLTPAPQQEYQQAKSNFISAVLRKESGAAITKSEYENEDKKYFPQPGDSAGVLAQKQAARDLAIKALEIQAGRPLPNATAAAMVPGAYSSDQTQVTGQAKGTAPTGWSAVKVN